MPDYTVHYKAATTPGQIDAFVTPVGGVPPTGVTLLGTITGHEEEELESIDEGYAAAGQHVLYHHVRDLCYAKGILGMGQVNIKWDPVVKLTNFTLAKSTTSIVAGATESILATITPADGDDWEGFTVTSSAPTFATAVLNRATKAIVVTAVAAGTATITVKYAAVTRTIAVTVTAA